MSLFLPFTKVDAAQRLVYGTISEEVPDKTGEILDYESAKPAFEEWSLQFHQASGGRSLGNVRAMHNSIAIGKLTDIHYDDANRRIQGVAKIIDDDEWRKVEEGIYTGFSIGGGYARRWQDEENPRLMRYTPVLAEVSLVDNPAVPTATFEFIRMDGVCELRKLGDKPEAAQPQAEQLLEGLNWLEAHAKAIGAQGLLAHIKALQSYLEEVDEGDAMDAQTASNTQADEEDTSAEKVVVLHHQIDTLRKHILQLEEQPLPAKGALRAFGKTEDRIAAQEPAALAPADKVRELMKIALANPMPL